MLPLIAHQFGELQGLAARGGPEVENALFALRRQENRRHHAGGVLDVEPAFAVGRALGEGAALGSRDDKGVGLPSERRQRKALRR